MRAPHDRRDRERPERDPSGTADTTTNPKGDAAGAASPSSGPHHRDPERPEHGASGKAEATTNLKADAAGAAPPASDPPTAERLEALRAEIAAVDEALVQLLARRLAAAREIGGVKQQAGTPVMDPAREAEVVRRAAAAARKHGVDPELVRSILWLVMDHARAIQQR